MEKRRTNFRIKHVYTKFLHFYPANSERRTPFTFLDNYSETTFLRFRLRAVYPYVRFGTNIIYAHVHNITI